MLTWRCTPEATCARRSGACAHACCSCRAIRTAISPWARPSAKQPCSAIGACFVPSSPLPAIAREIRTDRSLERKPRGSGGTCTSCLPSRHTPHSTALRPALAVASWRTSVRAVPQEGTRSALGVHRVDVHLSQGNMLIYCTVIESVHDIHRIKGTRITGSR